MSTTIALLSVLLIFKLLFIVLSNAKNSKAKKVPSKNYDKDKIESGFPTSNTISLHINSTKEPPFPNHNYTNKELNQFDKDYDDTQNAHIYTKNMFVESHNELNLSLFNRQLTEQSINEAYDQLLNKHIQNIAKGIPDDFNITVKKEARDYLLNYLNNDPKE